MSTGATYSVDLLHPARDEILLTLDDFAALDVAQRENDVGAFEIVLPWWVQVGTDGARQRLTFGFLDSLLDARLVVWRQPEGGRKSILFAGLVRYWSPAALRGGREVVLRGPDYNDVLRRRRVVGAAGSAAADKSGAADTVMRALVVENLGASAATARDMSDYGLSVAAAAGTGTTISKACAYWEVLRALQDIHEQSRNTAATATWFGVVPTGSGWGMEFRTRTGQWGMDHRSQVGSAAPVVFSMQNRNMEDPVLTVDHRDEVTFAYGRGRGVGEERDPATTVTDVTRRNRSPLNRIEDYFDGRNYERESTELERATREVLEAGRPQQRLTFAARDTERCVFGRDWGFGDRVTAQFMEYRADMRVAAYRLQVAGKRETFSVSLEG